jgi:hypothetical protein
MLIENDMQATDVEPEVSVHQSVAEAGQGTKALCQRFWKNFELAQLIDATRVVGHVVARASHEVRCDVENVLDRELQSALDSPALREIFSRWASCPAYFSG